MVPLPPYDAPFTPVPNITPFTYRDGATLLKKLENLKRYINRDLVPFVNTNYSDLAEAFETQVNLLLQQVNEAVDEVVNSGVVVQDPVVAGILANPASLTRVALNNILASYYTESEADVKFHTKAQQVTDLEAINTALGNIWTKTQADVRYVLGTDYDADQTTLDGRLDPIEALVAPPSGRLSKTQLDLDYVTRFRDPVAVFIGSSNSHVNYGWTQGLATKKGWIHKNYSINGGSFSVPSHPDSFRSQLNNAIADPSFDNAKVEYLFVTDMSNDIRGNGSVFTQAVELFGIAQNNFPNARIIMIPVVFPFNTVHQTDLAIRTSVSKRYEEAMEASYAYDRVEIIENTWLWFWDAGNWLEGVNPNYHLNNAGYTRLIWYIEQYLKHANIDNQIAWSQATQIVSSSNMGAGFFSRRIHGQVTAIGDFQTFINTPQDTDVCRLAPGTAPSDTILVNGTHRDTRAPGYPIYIYPDGTVRLLAAIPGSTRVWYNASYTVI